MLSFGNAVLMLTVSILDDYCEAHPTDGGKNSSSLSMMSPCTLDKLTRVDALRGLISIECMAIGALWTYYTQMVRGFNKEKKHPDIFEEEMLRGLQQDADEAAGRRGRGRASRQNSQDQQQDENSVAVYGPAAMQSYELHSKAVRDKVLELQAEKLRYFERHIKELNDYAHETRQRLIVAQKKLSDLRRAQVRV